MRQCRWRHLVAIFATNASGSSWWPKPHISLRFCNCGLFLQASAQFCCQLHQIECQSRLQYVFVVKLCTKQLLQQSLMHLSSTVIHLLLLTTDLSICVLNQSPSGME